ncbi:hypothetical protein IFM89_000393 [Coptis chinensis]|uniref:C2 NT-type domain-containing protein n=1 Tax=Coptis chinensis TaxID=261450 RepID=A0A835H877_9MAGN|nr:hypothetical protein IFM89_000393 [Coptis chinensis]
MVVKMMRWRPWPPIMTKKYEVKLVVKRLQGLGIGLNEEGSRLKVEVRWKGGKNGFSSLRRTGKRDFTKEEEVNDDCGFVEWNEEFQSFVTLSAYKENAFHPWEISLSVLNVLSQGQKIKTPIFGIALLNLAEYASEAGKDEFEVSVPLTLTSGDAEPHPSICLFFRLLELRTTQENSETVQRAVSPIPLSPRSEALSSEKDELSALKAGLRKVNILKNYVSTRRAKKAREEEDSEGRCSARSDDADVTYPFDTDSLDDCEEGELEDSKDESNLRKSFSYGTLAHANFAGGSYYSDMRINGDSEDLIYYSHRKSDVGSLPVEDSTSVPEQSLLQSSKRSLLSWRKRKLSFRSPKAKGEPLLKKAYAEEGGDDIDYDRRQLNSSDESLSLGWHKADEGSTTNRSSVSEFGDDSFAVGSWEHKEVVSRDGQMKLSTQVFYASIDQRSERAAGESACTALVAVIADWFQANQDLMPIRCQFDSLIREGSLEWRNLCGNEIYRTRFPDKHFDLDTVLQAKIRPLTVAPEKSFIGFFHPEGMEEGGFDFLHGAMSFDGIWDEISRTGSNCPSNGSPQIYIVSWNDHFFVLKVDPEAYYIIDTLGERLYEGCDQAYILKFDRETTICRLPSETQLLEGKTAADQKTVAVVEGRNGQVQQTNNLKETPVTMQLVAKPEELGKTEGEEEVVCRGKESCKEYIKKFLAAIPIRELQVDIKKGLMDSTPLHHRLQIEFHYTEFLQPTPEPQAVEAAGAIVAVVPVVEAC